MHFIFYYLFCSVIVLKCSCSRDHFYPFGMENGDVRMFKNDDLFVGPFPVPADFKFFNKTYSTLFVNTNGLISLSRGLNYYNPSQFTNEIVGFAAFWNDIDTLNAGDIFYRQVLDDLTMKSISFDIQQSIPG